MKIVKQSVDILTNLNQKEILSRLEIAGRVCYKSEHRISVDSAEKFIANIIRLGHESVLEHVSIGVRFIIDRGVSHELVRHRLASYSQESTRYCRYSDEVVFIEPPFETEEDRVIWQFLMIEIEKTYIELLNRGVKPEITRSVLPNSLKTEVIMTANIREWRHIMKIRTDEKAHPQIREVCNLLKKELVEKLPVLFGDLV